MMTLLSLLLIAAVLSLFLLMIQQINLKKDLEKLKRYLDAVLEEKKLNTLLLIKNRNISQISELISDLELKTKALKKEISEKDELINNLFYPIPLPIAFLRADGRIAFKSKAFDTLFKGIDNIENLKNILREPDFYKALEYVFKNGGERSGEILWEGKYFSFLCQTVDKASLATYLLFLIDITEIKKTQQIRNEFTSNVSHELKTPLTVIKGYIETLESEIDNDKLFMINAIKRHITRLENLVSDILTLETVDSGKTFEPRAFRFNDLIANSITLLEKNAKDKGIELTFVSNQEVDYIGDSFLLMQVLINLLSNAIKFTPSGGKVTISIRTEKSDVIISVKDTGIGIPDKYKEKIFERFFVIDKSRSRELGGTGLGLAIVKHIVELHKGEIKLLSDVGKGSEFIIKLPFL